MVHYHLVKNYRQVRSTVAMCYAQILDDLEHAEGDEVRLEEAQYNDGPY